MLRRPDLGPLMAAHLVVYGLARLGRLDDAVRLVSRTPTRGAP